MEIRDREVGLRKLNRALMIGVPLFLFALTSTMLFEEVGPDEIVVVQQPFTGKLSWYDTPGWAWQGYGTVTTYKKRETLEFPPPVKDASGRIIGGGIEIRFKDGGHARMFGSVQFALPTSPMALNKLHSNYRGSDLVRKNLLETTVGKSVYLVGTLMTSKESYAEKRNDLIHYATDQIQSGVYRTRQKTENIKDDITGQYKQVTGAEIILDKDGKPERQEDSVLNEYGIRAFNFTITQMPYDDAIEQQIRQQQEIAMSVQTSIAEAARAEQRAITAEADGRANAQKAKWEQETIRAREVTKAEQEKQVATTKAEQEKVVAVTAAERDRQVAATQGDARVKVADFNNKAAELDKKTQILLGEGESARKKLVLEADGALAQKIEAWVTAQRVWADAFGKYQGQIVPSVVTAGGGATPQNGAQSFMELMSVNAAKQLQLDMSVRK